MLSLFAIWPCAFLVSYGTRSFACALTRSLALTTTAVFSSFLEVGLVDCFYVFHYNPPKKYGWINIKYVPFVHIWLGYCDSNTGMSESESDALPLGDTPMYLP